eukprot:TRINITY_DN8500_c0_g1_i1.p1 TRINITY_DN8500_c0_g1~~TRINITY_DN8500_c0_g1_i1.p1  ORF type:complete len:811 (-),score=442.92 TRINITY_DN8500_c0_g1_i1:72-2348(-)
MKRLAEDNNIDLPRRTDLPQLYFNKKLVLIGDSTRDELDHLIYTKQWESMIKECIAAEEPDSLRIGIFHPGNGQKARLIWGEFNADEEEEDGGEDEDWEYEDEDGEDEEAEEEYEYEYEDDAHEEKPKKKEKQPKEPRVLSEEQKLETSLFTAYINSVFAEDNLLEAINKIPLNGDDQSLFDRSKDGVLLAKLINKAVPDTVDERTINIKKKLTRDEKEDNVKLVINSAKGIGCSLTGITLESICQGSASTILNLYWQIIRIGLLEKVNVKYHPELVRLLGKGELLQNFMYLSPDMRLLRWINSLLIKSEKNLKLIDNFGKDLKDGVVLTHLLNQINPQICSLDGLEAADALARASLVVDNADKLGCRMFVTPELITAPTVRFNLGFAAYLFDKVPTLEPLSPEETAKITTELFSSEGTREARAFCLWMNSLRSEGLVTNLFEDLKSGLVLLETMDKIQPGVVDWNGVNRSNLNKFKMIENCNRAIETGKKLKLSLVGIGGNDIYNGVETLILGLVWQLMRLQVITILKSVSLTGKEVTENEIVQWANCEVRGVGKTTKMEGFKDQTLKNGKFLIDLLYSINDRIINYDLVTEGEIPEDQLQNAKYAISIARKLGATVFVLPEDIVEVKPKMLLTLFASIMAIALGSVEERKEKLKRMQADQERREKLSKQKAEKAQKQAEEQADKQETKKAEMTEKQALLEKLRARSAAKGPAADQEEEEEEGEDGEYEYEEVEEQEGEEQEGEDGEEYEYEEVEDE